MLTSVVNIPSTYVLVSLQHLHFLMHIFFSVKTKAESIIISFTRKICLFSPFLYFPQRLSVHLVLLLSNNFLCLTQDLGITNTILREERPSSSSPICSGDSYSAKKEHLANRGRFRTFMNYCLVIFFFLRRLLLSRPWQLKHRIKIKIHSIFQNEINISSTS